MRYAYGGGLPSFFAIDWNNYSTYWIKKCDKINLENNRSEKMERKGFTLIELLAVIVILSVIALIATPLVMKTIEDSKKSSFKISVQNMIRAMKTEQAMQDYISLSYQFPLTENTTLKLDGDTSKWQGESSIDEDGKTVVAIYNGTYCAHKKRKENEVVLTKVGSKQECIELSKTILPVLAVAESGRSATSKFLNGPITRESIESIRFSAKLETSGTVTGSFDVSDKKDGSVVAYYSDNDNNGFYELVIAGEEGVAANASSKGLFSSLINVTIIDTTNFDTSNVTDMSYMFAYDNNLTSLDLSHFDTSNVTNMDEMFNNCNSLTNLDLSHFDTSKVTNMYEMFFACTSLISLDLSNFDTSNVTNMGEMFYNCNKLTNLDLRNFDTSNVTSMGGMFSRCRSLTNLDIRNMAFETVTNYSSMFSFVISGVSIIVRDSTAKTFIEARLSEVGRTGIVTIG